MKSIVSSVSSLVIELDPPLSRSVNMMGQCSDDIAPGHSLGSGQCLPDLLLYTPSCGQGAHTPLPGIETFNIGEAAPSHDSYNLCPLLPWTPATDSGNDTGDTTDPHFKTLPLTRSYSCYPGITATHQARVAE